MVRAEIQTALNALTKDQIDAVLTEWRQVGREEFLRTHKVNRAAKFKIRDENNDYDAKAILVVALRRFRAEYQEIKSTEIESNELTIATPLRDLGYSVVEINDDPLKINDEVVAAEVRSLLQIDNSRLGEVWRLNQKGISHQEIATQLGAKTSSFVNKILRFVRAIEIGKLPTARTMVEECHDKLKAFMKAHDAQMSELTRLVLSERLSELLNRKEGKRTLDEMIQEVLDLNKSYVQDNDAPPMRRRFK
jgi:DNA-binding FrmR family transcriptional regulator